MGQTDRILVEAFTAGPAAPREYLLGLDHRLHADAEPHEVRLAEAECIEGCSGAFYVTVQRRGDEVVSRDWRNPVKQSLGCVTLVPRTAMLPAGSARLPAFRSSLRPRRGCL